MQRQYLPSELNIFKGTFEYSTLIIIHD
jgi:hypothetical protein